jgi:hypothetical protein
VFTLFGGSGIVDALIENHSVKDEMPTILQIQNYKLYPDLQPHLEKLRKFCCLISKTLYLNIDIGITFDTYDMLYDVLTGKYDTTHYDAIVEYEAEYSMITSIENNYDLLKHITLKI